MVNLQTYQSHKKVQARKIMSVQREPEGGAILVFAPLPGEELPETVTVDADYVQRHRPQSDGYFVVYEDGYQSWSPASVFEAGNTRVLSVTVLRAGHRYSLPSFDGGPPQEIQFIEKGPVSEGSQELMTLNDGTTNEVVLTAMIDRMKHLQSKFSCRENACAITHLEEALFWMNERTEKRRQRGVEGKHIA